MKSVLHNYFVNCIEKNQKIKILLLTDLEVDDQFGIRTIVYACAGLISELDYQGEVEFSVLAGEGNPDIQVFRAYQLLALLKEDHVLPENLKIDILRGFSANREFAAAGFEFINETQINGQENTSALFQYAQEHQLLSTDGLGKLSALLAKTESNASALSFDDMDERDTYLKKIYIQRELTKPNYGSIPSNESKEQAKFRNEVSEKEALSKLEAYFSEKVLFLCMKPPREAFKLLEMNPGIFDYTEFAGTFGFNTRVLVEEAQEKAEAQAKLLKLNDSEKDALIAQATTQKISHIIDLLSHFSKVSFFESGPSLGGEDSMVSFKVVTKKNNPDIYWAMDATGEFGKMARRLISNWNQSLIKTDRKMIMDYASTKGLLTEEVGYIGELLRSEDFTEETYKEIFNLILPDWKPNIEDNTEQDKSIAYALERKKSKLLFILSAPEQAIIVDFVFIVALCYKTPLFNQHELYFTMEGTKSLLSIDEPKTLHVKVFAILPLGLDPVDYITFSKIPAEKRKEIYKSSSPITEATMTVIKRVYQCYLDSGKLLEKALLDSFQTQLSYTHENVSKI